MISSLAGGVQWSKSLPKIDKPYDEIFLAPDGSAAVVGGMRANRGSSPYTAYLVGGGYSPVEVGLGIVDFQSGRALVSSAQEGSQKGYRAVIYSTSTGQVLQDLEFEDRMPEEYVDTFAGIELSRDGKAIYYVALAENGAQIPRVRATLSGKTLATTADLPFGEINDFVMFSAHSGFIVVNGVLYRISASGAVPVEMPQPPLLPITGVRSVLLSPDGRHLAIGSWGRRWGLLDIGANRWLHVEQPASAPDLVWSDGALVVSQSTRVSSRLRSFEPAARELRALSAMEISRANFGAGVGSEREPMCINAYGVMVRQPKGKDRDADFLWKRARVEK